MDKIFAVSACVFVASAATAIAGGQSDVEAHGGPGYPSGAGGWGGAVSETAKANKGIPNAHPDD